jgi:hypothetical protein
MGTMLTATGSGAVALVLVVSFVAHLLSPRVLPRALRAHGVFPARLAATVAVAALAGEAIGGVLTGAGLLASQPVLVRAGSIVCVVLLACYAVYARHVARQPRTVPCGCDAAGTPMTNWIAIRAAGLAVLALTGAVHPGLARMTGPELTVGVLAAVSFAVIAWILPSALTDPDAAPAA